MTRKYYRIDFYQISIMPTAEIATPEAGLQAMVAGTIASSFHDGDYTRELFGLNVRRGGSSMAGRLRKFRTSDLPEIGGLGEDAEALVLGQDQGLIEQNFFVWYREHNVIAWHVNGHASPVARFALFLSELWGARISIGPILQADALRRLMSGGADVKRFSVSIPRPTNADLFSDDDFSENALRMMNHTGADSMHLEMGVNARLHPQGRLEDIKEFLRKMTSAGATTVRAFIEEDDGIIHPIDLIADRVSATVSSDGNSRFPTPDTMYQMIDAAHTERQGDINEYFGEPGRVLA